MTFQVPLDPREERRARNVGWATTILSAVLVALIAYLGYAAWVGSDRLVNPEPSHVCRLPSAFGWAYQAINYDQTSDAELAAEADPDNCTVVGQPAGTELTATGRVGHRPDGPDRDPGPRSRQQQERAPAAGRSAAHRLQPRPLRPA
jgi:hypothetical protein